MDCVLPASPVWLTLTRFGASCRASRQRGTTYYTHGRASSGRVPRRGYQPWAKRAGHATTGVYRAGASLNVHVHFHVVCLDGVYVEAAAKDGALRFEASSAAEASHSKMPSRSYRS